MAAMFLSLHGLQEVCRTELLSHPKEEEDGESTQAPSGQVSCPNPATCPASFTLGVLLPSLLMAECSAGGLWARTPATYLLSRLLSAVT